LFLPTQKADKNPDGDFGWTAMKRASWYIRINIFLNFFSAWLFYVSKAFSVSKSPYDPDVSSTMTTFRDWLDEQEVEGFEATEIGIKNDLRGVFAKQRFEQSEYILAVPYVSCILLSETVHDLSQSNDLSDVTKGFHLWQRCSSEKHRWKSYLDCLPTRQSNFAATPDFWPDEYLVEILSLLDETQQRREEIQYVSEIRTNQCPVFRFAICHLDGSIERILYHQTITECKRNEVAFTNSVNSVSRLSQSPPHRPQCCD
jgi:hypothetical protein